MINFRSKFRDAAATRLNEHYDLVPKAANGENVPKKAYPKAADKIICDLIGSPRDPGRIKLGFLMGVSAKVSQPSLVFSYSRSFTGSSTQLSGTPNLNTYQESFLYSE
jgi:hypothetical protein